MPKHYRHWAEMETLTRLRNIHPETLCAGETCVIHNPTKHHMRAWPLIWRADRGIFERICEHGIGHDDPDCAAFRKGKFGPGASMHGCDGCCYASG